MLGNKAPIFQKYLREIIGRRRKIDTSARNSKVNHIKKTFRSAIDIWTPKFDSFLGNKAPIFQKYLREIIGRRRKIDTSARNSKVNHIKKLLGQPLIFGPQSLILS